MKRAVRIGIVVCACTSGSITLILSLCVILARSSPTGPHEEPRVVLVQASSSEYSTRGSAHTVVPAHPDGLPQNGRPDLSDLLQRNGPAMDPAKQVTMNCTPDLKPMELVDLVLRTIALPISREKQILCTYEALDCIATKAPAATDAKSVKELGEARHTLKAILLTLNSPQQAVQDAWNAYERKDEVHGIFVLECFASNRNYSSQELQLTIGLWLAKTGRPAEARQRIKSVLADKTSRVGGFALAVDAIACMRQADLDGVATDLLELQKQFPSSPLAHSAQVVSTVIRRVARDK